MSTVDWDAEAVVKTAAIKLLRALDADIGDEAVEVTSQLLARLLSRLLLAPLAKRYDVLEQFKERYDRDQARQQIADLVNLIALAMPAETPDGLDDPEVARALDIIRDLVGQELGQLVDNPSDEVVVALRNDFGSGTRSEQVSTSAAGAGGGCLIGMMALAACALAMAARVRRW